ncbi:MAG: SGNH/GDSL hydrolase family protein [Clostridiales bacterium]|nr:SGNH/GDSL hydrolase family protein [Clostridiales bacterium]
MVKTFEHFYDLSEGVLFFAPDDEAAYAAGKPCNGFGSVRYREGSIYCGQLYFDGAEYNKLGFGRQDFLLSEIGALDSFWRIRKAFFIGQYDYRKTEWIYGNGVLYYVNENNKPAFFKKGFFEGLTKVADYEGEFDYSTLVAGYTPDMECDFDDQIDTLDRALERRENVKSLDTLFIGDSYFEFWNKTEYTGELFYDAFDNANMLDIGVGGTKFSDWLRFMPHLDVLPQPKRILINLGFNDIHFKFSAEETFENYKKVLAQLRARFPQAEYMLLNVVKAPEFSAFYAEEEKLNQMTKAAEHELHVKVFDMRSEIERAGAGGDCFHADRVHLNARGYQAYSAFIKKILND